jgi:uncharacterized protein HemX
MVVLGLLLILAAVIFGADVVLENNKDIVGTIFNQTVHNLSLGGIFLAGAVTALVLALGLWLVLGGAARKRRKRVERKSTLRDTETQKESLAEENTRLARQLEEERKEKTTAAVSPYDDNSNPGSKRAR